MTHAGGRPRKVRIEEYCPCCRKKGYKRLIRGWNPKYKHTTIGSYYRFRHDDRKFICRKCKMNECYVDRQVKKAQRKDHRQNPPDKLIKLLLDAEKQMQVFRKFLFKEITVIKSWSLSNEENKRVDKTVTRVIELQRYYATIIDVILSLKALHYIIELKYRFGNVIHYNDKVAELIQDISSGVQTLSLFESSYLEIGNKDVKSILEPLDQLISDLDTKYGVQQRKDFKKELSRKYNFPKGTLDR